MAKSFDEAVDEAISVIGSFLRRHRSNWDADMVRALREAKRDLVTVAGETDDYDVSSAFRSAIDTILAAVEGDEPRVERSAREVSARAKETNTPDEWVQLVRDAIRVLESDFLSRGGFESWMNTEARLLRESVGDQFNRMMRGRQFQPIAWIIENENWAWKVAGDWDRSTRHGVGFDKLVRAIDGWIDDPVDIRRIHDAVNMLGVKSPRRVAAAVVKQIEKLRKAARAYLDALMEAMEAVPGKDLDRAKTKAEALRSKMVSEQKKFGGLLKKLVS